jgi:hypothetical protein
LFRRLQAVMVAHLETVMPVALVLRTQAGVVARAVLATTPGCPRLVWAAMAASGQRQVFPGLHKNSAAAAVVGAIKSAVAVLVVMGRLADWASLAGMVDLAPALQARHLPGMLLLILAAGVVVLLRGRPEEAMAEPGQLARLSSAI